MEQEDFWSEDHSKVLNAIREGFIQCHMDMWNELGIELAKEFKL